MNDITDKVELFTIPSNKNRFYELTLTIMKDKLNPAIQLR
jgi:hypothetical protein